LLGDVLGAAVEVLLDVPYVGDAEAAAVPGINWHSPDAPHEE